MYKTQCKMLLQKFHSSGSEERVKAVPRKQFLKESKSKRPVPQPTKPHSHHHAIKDASRTGNGTCSKLVTELYTETHTLLPRAPSVTQCSPSGRIRSHMMWRFGHFLTREQEMNLASFRSLSTTASAFLPP